jgi:hypothetical protein
MIYDHCAAVTRLYALYEYFVEELVQDYLRRLPEIFASYSDLPPSTRSQHRIGAGQIMQKWSESSPYKHLAEETIASGLVDGLRGQRNYKLLPDAFLIDPQNYRADILARIFGYLGFCDCLSFVKKQPDLKIFMLTRDSTETPETLLHEIVERRNQASHGSVSYNEIVSVSELASYADFIRILCGNLSEMIERNILSRIVETRINDNVGQVIKVFSGNIVGLRCNPGYIRVGERLIARRPNGAMGATVVSIETNHQRCEETKLVNGQEIGVKLDKKIKDGTLLMRLMPATDPNLLHQPNENMPLDNYEI